MKVKDVMTSDPACCTPDSNLKDVARMMVERNCGAIPVVENQRSKKPVGVVTDRDITCRAVAEGRNPLDLTAGELMTRPVLTLAPDDSLEECLNVMEERQVRRIPVVDSKGACCGIVAQADIARRAPEHETAELVRDISLSAKGGAGR